MSQLIASAGPFLGVRDVGNPRGNGGAPYIDASKYLENGINGFFPNLANTSSWVARPAFTNTNPSSQMGTGQRGQGMHSHVDPNTGAIYRFFVVNGVLYRSDAAFAVFTDVTPVGITIDTGTYTRASMLSVGSSMVFTDGVNTPWVASNFASTPITATEIDYDGLGSAWSTWGKPTLYQDSVIFITQTVPGAVNAEPRISIVWCEPNQPLVGYEQSGYENFWNLIQTASDPLFAILGTNDGLYLWRQNAIEIAVGTPSINFSTTATRSAIGIGVGSVSPWAVAQFGSTIFFVDNRGRPWSVAIGSEPVDIWKQLYHFATGQQAGALDPTVLSSRAVGSFVPELDRYLVAPWSADTSTPPVLSPQGACAFDGSSGSYDGLWTLSSLAGMDAMDTMLDANGASVLCIVGGLNGAPSGGYVWVLNSLVSASTTLDSRAQLKIIPLAYKANVDMYPDYAVLILMTSDTLTVTVGTPYGLQVLANVTPQGDGLGTTFRAVIGLDGVATRYLSFNITPTTSMAGWSLQRIEVYGSTSPAGPDDR